MTTKPKERAFEEFSELTLSAVRDLSHDRAGDQSDFHVDDLVESLVDLCRTFDEGFDPKVLDAHDAGVENFRKEASDPDEEPCCVPNFVYRIQERK